MSSAGGTHHHGLFAGLSAGAAAVLFAFGLLALAWHQVAGQVSLAITVLAYAVIAACAVVTGAGTWYVLLWVRHRARNPHLLAGRPRAVRAEVVDAEVVPQAIEAVRSAAIEPPRVYLNVTPDQLAAILSRTDHEGESWDG